MFSEYNVGVEQSNRGQCISADLHGEKFHIIYRVFLYKNDSKLNFIDKTQENDIQSQYSLENHLQAYGLFKIAQKDGYDEIVSSLDHMTPINKDNIER